MEGSYQIMISHLAIILIQHTRCSSIKLEWGGMKSNGKVLSSEGRGIILALEQNLGDLIPEAYLFHDPWELLEQLIERLDDIKKSKQKRLRIKRLMNKWFIM